MATVYRIQFDPTGRFYYGSSQATLSRWADHIRDLKAGNHHCQGLQAVFNEWGADVALLSFKVVKQGLQIDEARDLEVRLISEDPECYNTPGPQMGGFSPEKRLNLCLQVREMRAQGYTYRRIGQVLGCGTSTAFYAMRDTRKSV